MFSTTRKRISFLLRYESESVIVLKLTPLFLRAASATDAFVLRLNENDHIDPSSIQRLSRAIFLVQSASFHTQSLFYSFFSYE